MSNIVSENWLGSGGEEGAWHDAREHLFHATMDFEIKRHLCRDAAVRVRPYITFMFSRL